MVKDVPDHCFYSEDCFDREMIFLNSSICV